MNNEQQKKGFSLTEVLLAIGTLAIGMLFIAGVFPVGIHFTTIATERTIAAVAADEAFAKIKLYGNYIELGDLKDNELTVFNKNVLLPGIDIEDDEFTYPSNENADISQKQYCWSALCRLTEEYNPSNNPNPPVQVTVFVCRKTGAGLRYPEDDLDVPKYDWPRPAIVGVEYAGERNRLRIRSRPGASDDKRFINDGYTIVDDETGRIYRVLERYKALDDDIILLDRDWDQSDPGGQPERVWVIPPPAGGGRYPRIAVYQKVIKF